VRIDYPRASRDRWTRFLPSWRQLLALGTAGAALVLVAFGIAYAAIDVPDPNPDISKAATIVYYDDGKTELGRYAELNRVPVTIEQVPVHLRQAVLSAEDRSFYDNRGVSPRGIVRAFVNNVRGGSKQGGSTITQQYVKNGYLTQERTLERKGKEFVVALKVDSELSKDEILANYLNAIFWGRGSYGVQAASTAYFGKPVEKLTVSESAFLAGIIQSPSRYEPTTGREGAERRWNYVLDGMVTRAG
jgi:membrane peptidoglycan carboxypeptidase